MTKHYVANPFTGAWIECPDKQTAYETRKEAVSNIHPDDPKDRRRILNWLKHNGDVDLVYSNNLDECDFMKTRVVGATPDGVVYRVVIDALGRVCDLDSGTVPYRLKERLQSKIAAYITAVTLHHTFSPVDVLLSPLQVEVGKVEGRLILQDKEKIPEHYFTGPDTVYIRITEDGQRMPIKATDIPTVVVDGVDRALNIPGQQLTISVAADVIEKVNPTNRRCILELGPKPSEETTQTNP